MFELNDLKIEINMKTHLICVFLAATRRRIGVAERLHLIEPFLELIVLMQKLLERYISAQILVVALNLLRPRVLKAKIKRSF